VEQQYIPNRGECDTIFRTSECRIPNQFGFGDSFLALSGKLSGWEVLSSGKTVLPRLRGEPEDRSRLAIAWSRGKTGAPEPALSKVEWDPDLETWNCANLSNRDYSFW